MGTHDKLAEEKATLAAIAEELEEALGSHEVPAAAIKKMLDDANDTSAVELAAASLQHIVGSLTVPNNISARLMNSRTRLRVLRNVAAAGPSYGLQQ
jgi:hypothetical protein